MCGKDLPLKTQVVTHQGTSAPAGAGTQEDIAATEPDTAAQCITLFFHLFYVIILCVLLYTFYGLMAHH